METSKSSLTSELEKPIYIAFKMTLTPQQMWNFQQQILIVL